MANGNQKHRNTKADDNDDKDIDDVSSNGSNRATAAMRSSNSNGSLCNKCDGKMQQTTYLDRPPQTSGGLSPATPAERIPVQMAHI
jgi:hypothetical protein